MSGRVISSLVLQQDASTIYGIEFNYWVADWVADWVANWVANWVAYWVA
ncbi:hypothetical protein [Oligella urethralis]|nr:hypothetical protein [Oligella urethralis]